MIDNTAETPDEMPQGILVGNTQDVLAAIMAMDDEDENKEDIYYACGEYFTNGTAEGVEISDKEFLNYLRATFEEVNP
jgi:hypothetical protein